MFVLQGIFDFTNVYVKFIRFSLSMSARGPELERQLAELLGPAGDGDSEGNEGEDK